MTRVVLLFLLTIMLTACARKPLQKEPVEASGNTAIVTETLPANRPDTVVLQPADYVSPPGITPPDNYIVPAALPKDTVKPPPVLEMPAVTVGAQRTAQYLPLLQNKRVALVVNQTSVIGSAHLADTLLSLGVQVIKVFAPEHGFRGDADAGAQIANAKDARTGMPLVSLYGKNKKPTAADLQDIDVVVFDIQDVGARFYTYISTMHYVMEACAEQNKEMIVLDRPNPNGHYVDGPVLDLRFRSFVGMHPIPVVHGLTVGELALMINEEGWLENGAHCNLTVIPCINYNHTTRYQLPIKPSPNLPNMQAIYLYPSLCLFEGAKVSVGRGTNKQFQVIGSPKYKYPFSFTPVSKPGATHPLFENELCFGFDLSNIPPDTLKYRKQLDLNWILRLYADYPDKPNFFSDFFNKLAGNSQLMEQIKSGLPMDSIRKSWQPQLQTYKQKRKRYLLYEDFE